MGREVQDAPDAAPGSHLVLSQRWQSVMIVGPWERALRGAIGLWKRGRRRSGWDWLPCVLLGSLTFRGKTLFLCV